MTTPPAPQSELPERDVELLSAYIDNELAPADRAALEQRLALEPRLRRELAELRATRDLLRDQPWVTPPRSFTLTPDMASPRRRWFALPSWLQPLSGLAALALVMLIGWQVLRLNSGASPAAQPQVMMAPATMPATGDATAPDSPTAAAMAPAAVAGANERNAQAAEETVVGLAVQPTVEQESTAMQPSQAGGGANGIAPGAGGDAGPPPDVQRQPVQPSPPPPSPPPLPVVIGLAILIIIAAGVWLARRRME
ncbi:zf-HC2 domain-containing protein [Chloroflexus sp.]|uniref:anti-sigma factor family protein n=1 Tax=Chloroflexus sp. TaxID=1904827 RepID=UPI00298EFFDB|nr:zf-HC2 domain-containing protein [Chloroflexus sp.]MCS6888375.1 zf-HC2 domain-containing protein [Chloroflexus sp.]MDW8404247.1 zf-HC2 domain-containing protein [Chloroflexus sp.]